MTASQRSQVEWLAHDFAEIRRLIEGSDVFSKLADTQDLATHAARLVVADLVWQIWSHTMGAYVLLQNTLRAPLIVAQRASFEGMISLGYLTTRANVQEEAQVFLAHSFLREIAAFHDQPELVAERTRNLARIPEALRQLAEKRLSTRPHNWSGRSFKAMATAGGIAGYDEGYRYLCGEAHVSILGGHVRVLTREDGGTRILTGREIDANEIEAHANFARRSLHAAFRILWKVVDATPVEIHSEDPAAWSALT